MSEFSLIDHRHMKRALVLAQQALIAGEVPVGAVVSKGNTIIGEAYNSPIGLHDPTAHAEISALRQAASNTGNYRLTDSTLYVTLEPCYMCAGAIIHARVARIVYAASDPKTGVAGSVYDLFQSDYVNHRTSVNRGLFAEESATLLKDFFRGKR